MKEDNGTNRGRMEEETNQLYRRPQMTEQARDEEEEEAVAVTSSSQLSFFFYK